MSHWLFSIIFPQYFFISSFGCYRFIMVTSEDPLVDIYLRNRQCIGHFGAFYFDACRSIFFFGVSSFWNQYVSETMQLRTNAVRKAFSLLPRRRILYEYLTMHFSMCSGQLLEKRIEKSNVICAIFTTSEIIGNLISINERLLMGGNNNDSFYATLFIIYRIAEMGIEAMKLIVQWYFHGKFLTRFRRK